MKRCVCCAMTIAVLMAFPAMVEADSLEGTFSGAFFSDLEGSVNVEITFNADATAAWELPDGFTYYDDDSHFTYQFPTITGTSGSYTYHSSTGAMTLTLDWSGSVQANNTSNPMYCKMLHVSGSSLILVTSQSGARTISGSLSVSQQYYYAGYGTWTESGTDPSFSMTSVPDSPTPTPTANYDLVPDGFIDARDLLEVLREIHADKLPAESLIDFSRKWR